MIRRRLGVFLMPIRIPRRLHGRWRGWRVEWCSAIRGLRLLAGLAPPLGDDDGAIEP
jgi:hypothetical protein